MRITSVLQSFDELIASLPRSRCLASCQRRFLDLDLKRCNLLLLGAYVGDSGLVPGDKLLLLDGFGRNVRECQPRVSGDVQRPPPCP